MKLLTLYDIDSVIRNLEASLLIDGGDYEEKDIAVVFKHVRDRIERQYQISLEDGKITDDTLDVSLCRQAVVGFLSNIMVIHATLCGVCQIMRYTSASVTNLKNVNYLGYTKDNMDTALIAMQRDKTQPRAQEAMNAIRNKISTISNCREKRLIMCMLVCNNLGVDEVVAAIAEIIYLGGLMDAFSSN